MIKNEYHIDNDIIYIHITNKKKELYYALVDLKNLELLLSNNYSWHLGWSKRSLQNYAETTIYLGIIEGKPKYKTLRLHNFIIGTNKLIDHKNHKMLDNRNDNLRLTTKTNNSRNRIKMQSTNKSGHRNVCWVKSRNRWIVQLQVDGKNKVLGTFKYEDLDKAGQFAKEMRLKYYGEFSGE